MDKTYYLNFVDQNLRRIRNSMLYQKGALERLKEQEDDRKQKKEKVNPSDNLYLTNQKAGEQAVRWVVSNKSGHLDIKPETGRSGDSVEISPSLTRESDSLDLPPYLRIIGYKIDLKAQVEKFIEAYMKNYIQTKSHNLILAKFSEFKVSIMGWLLSLAGVNSQELQRLQKKALASAISENKLLFDENEYNAELISIIGGSSRQAKAQLRVTAEIRKQIISQSDRMGLKEYFTDDFITEIRLKHCRSIMNRFREEEMKLEYQLAYC